MAELLLNNFTHKLYNKLGAQKHENFFISPYSISTALAMCYFGARNETAQQLKDLLSLSSLSDKQILEMESQLISNINEKLGGEVVISTANKIYPNGGARQEFIDLVTKSFMSDVQEIDFSNSVQAAQIINKWVAEQTRDKIKDLVSPSVLNRLTKMVLVNAIYFKGNWLSKFDANATIKKDFNAIDGRTYPVDMMHLNGKKFLYFSRPGGIPASTCTFPYIGRKVAMTVILPDKGTSLDQVESALSHDIINTLYTTGMADQPVNVQLPKFKLEHKVDLKEPLIQLGAVLPFDQARADFSGIRNDIFISAILHQAVVEVNEEGTEAAAATAVVMALKSAMPRVPAPPKEFICDRPFMFLIHELNHKTTLFIGKYVKP